jgi:Mce-associated membrane protein
MAVDAVAAAELMGATDTTADIDSVGAEQEATTSDGEHPDAQTAAPGGRWRRARLSRVATAGLVGLCAVAALGVLAGWFVVQEHHDQQAQQHRQLLLEGARQGALNLTTIDFQHADADVKRILDNSIDQFHQEFAQRSAAFADVLKQTKSTSVGTVTDAGLESADAGLESADADQAEVLVAVSVKISNGAGADQQPRAWRMRLSVKEVGDQVKVSNVAFVP